MSNQDSSSPNENRRRVLQTLTGTATAVAGLGITSETASGASCGIPDESGSYDEVNYEKKKEDSFTEENVPSGSGTEYAIETQTSVLHLESNYVSEDDRWTHYFYEGAHIVTQSKKSYESDSEYTLLENINTHRVTIYNLYEDDTSMFVTDNSYDVGAVPSPNGSTDDNGYADAAFTVIKAALSSASKTFSVATVALDVVGSLINNGEADSGAVQEYQWDYSPPDVCEAAHFSHFIIRGQSGFAKANVDVNEYSVADAGNVNNSHTWNLYVDPFDGGTTSVDAQSFEQMSRLEKVRYMERSDSFKRIPADEVDSADTGPVFQAVDPLVEITSTTRS